MHANTPQSGNPCRPRHEAGIAMAKKARTARRAQQLAEDGVRRVAIYIRRSTDEDGQPSGWACGCLFTISSRPRTRIRSPGAPRVRALITTLPPAPHAPTSGLPSFTDVYVWPAAHGWNANQS
jgi:hypothetical protein